VTARTIFLCAGEASGDLHGANLMKALKLQDPELRFVGVGGPMMRALGLECHQDAETLSVVGLVEVLKNIKFFKRTLDELTQVALKSGAKVFIPIDFPDFNLRLSERLKKKGFKVIYYVCPQVWAWRRSRVKVIEKIVDVLMTIFPFEAEYFSQKKLKVEFVGHPLCDQIPLGEKPQNPREGTGKLAILPGSRHSEIEQHLPILVPYMREAHRSWPELEFHIPCAQTLKVEDLEAMFPADFLEAIGSKLVVHSPGQSEKVLELCHAALIASGTSILQGVLSNRPLALFYRLNPVTFWIGKRLIKLPHVGLANLVAQREICSELLQDDMSVANLMSETERLMWSLDDRSRMLKDFAEVQEKLGGVGASRRAAEVILENMPK
jgi:lipid-A-disaccharide synthase